MGEDNQISCNSYNKDYYRPIIYYNSIYIDFISHKQRRGCVCQVVETGESVAIKKVFQEGSRSRFNRSGSDRSRHGLNSQNWGF